MAGKPHLAARAAALRYAEAVLAMLDYGERVKCERALMALRAALDRLPDDPV